jgi:hypothetical protein
MIRAADWLGASGADPKEIAERRATQLISSNVGLLRDMGVSASVERYRGDPHLRIVTSSRVGAIPLISPVTGRPDFGLVVEPRFAWSSAGDMLAGTGFRVVPELLPVPDLPQSERRVPPWVLSSVVLTRILELLESLSRRFVLAKADLAAPRGQVDWGTYAANRFAVGRALSVPCRFPDLRDDEELRSALHWVVRRHRDALRGQMTAGIVVRKLIELCDSLITRLRGSSPRQPSARVRRTWSSQSIKSQVFRDGIEAIDWTLDERGLAGQSDLSGLAWRLDMDAFFEAWLESIAHHVAPRVGAQVLAGRTNATRVPLDWTPPSSGSQKSLIPDVVVKRDDVVVVLDAKYKRHAEDIERLGWTGVSDELREQHRNDVLQALAYSTLFDAPRVVACLAYPATPENWRRLNARGRDTMRATIRTAGSRTLELALMAIPLSGDREEAGASLRDLVSREA